jgi:aryl-alcohol dehydrogenase-like predicted oxidoreductase
MKYRGLGQTGERVSMVGIGGFHLSKPDDPELAIRIVRTALDNGINFLDSSWLLARTTKAAKNGESERYKVSQHFDSTALHPEWLG